MFGYEEIGQMSMDAIKKLNHAEIKCVVLTKGLLPIELAEQNPDNEYGITLISLNEEYRKRIEPGAASYENRIAALKALHDKGCKTWVSVEPFPTPNILEQDLMDILETVSFTDKIIFGRTNYNKEVTAYPNHNTFYNQQARSVINFCNTRGIDYHIKNRTITAIA